VAGETSIRHETGRWIFEAVQRMRGDPARVHHNRYDIEPLADGSRSTHWTSNNPAVGDAILSSYASPTGRYRGFECLQQRDERHYSARGTLLEEDKVISTWAVELERLLS
jgi:hypothetical protein